MSQRQSKAPQSRAKLSRPFDVRTLLRIADPRSADDGHKKKPPPELSGGGMN